MLFCITTRTLRAAVRKYLLCGSFLPLTQDPFREPMCLTGCAQDEGMSQWRRSTRIARLPHFYVDNVNELWCYDAVERLQEEGVYVNACVDALSMFPLYCLAAPYGSCLECL